MFPQAKLIIAGVALVLAFGSGYGFKSIRCENARLELETATIQKSLDDTAAYNKLASEYEESKKSNESLKYTIRERVRNAKDSSFGCTVNTDGMQLINDARRSGNTSQPNK